MRKKYFLRNLRPAGVVVEVEPLMQQRELVVGVEADAQPRLALLPHPEEVLIQTPAWRYSILIPLRQQSVERLRH